MAKIGEVEKKLLEIALKAMHNAYVLWGFRVGSAVLGENGQIYDGCNVESWISGLGTCAERCAINHAILHGNRRIEKIAIVADAHSHDDLEPCGACLQYIHDFAKSLKIKIIMAKVENERILFETVKLKTLEEMLPFPFRR